MNWVLNPPKTEIEVGGATYRLNTDWEACLKVWLASQDFNAGMLSPEGYADFVCECMFLDPKPDIFNAEALKMAGDYLNAFSDKDGGKSNIPPICIEQDISLIYKAFASKGYFLRKDRIDYEQFQSLISELPEDSEFMQIMRLRHLYYNERSKMTKEDTKACERIGWDKIKVRDLRKAKEKELLDDLYVKARNRARAEKGLPPL